MKTGGQYEVVLKKARPRFIPKKILRHHKLRVSERYSCNASVWIADTPQSNFKPTVNLTLQHNGDKIRFCFKDAVDLLNFIEEMRGFIGEVAPNLHDRHTKAVDEFLDFHRNEVISTFDDYTVYTVIQDRMERERKTKTVRVNRQTGEISEDSR